MILINSVQKIYILVSLSSLLLDMHVVRQSAVNQFHLQCTHHPWTGPRGWLLTNITLTIAFVNLIPLTIGDMRALHDTHYM